jgi:broad specificity phosphatase PhoE
MLPKQYKGGKTPMMKIAFVRHGPTLWNAEQRIQGRTDISLSSQGREKMALLLPPKGFEKARAYVSPLKRARETAALLGLESPIIDARLAEHDWGRWEGLTREEILVRDGVDAFERAGRGPNFMPPGGERTSDLIARVNSFLADTARNAEDSIAVAHRGILRSAYAIATGWDMLTPMPDSLDISKALVLGLDERGCATIAALNEPLPQKPQRG